MISSNTGSNKDGKFWLPKHIAPALMLFVAMAFSISPCLAQGNDESLISNWTTGWDFQQSYLYSSLYTKHYDPDPDHVNDQNMLGFEGQTRDKRIMGLAVFDNSFGQESQYLYVGRKWRAFGSDRWHYKLTGGLLNGYDEPYEDKIPLNGLGVAPAIVPTLGYKGKSFAIEFSQLGLAAGMITAGFTF
jgi:hypothetical protein